MPFQKGNKLWDNPKTKATQIKKGEHKSPTTEIQKGTKLTPEEIAKRPSRKGENNPSWKGGITPLNKKLRNSLEYKLWRNAVFERDKFTCVWCKTRGGVLQVDHIKPFAHYPELRFAIDNGRTLCVSCHETTDTYKGRTNRKRLLEL